MIISNSFGALVLSAFSWVLQLNLIFCGFEPQICPDCGGPVWALFAHNGYNRVCSQVHYLIFVETYNKSCEIGLLNIQCSQNEDCVGRTDLSRGGACLCNSDSYLSVETGYCEAYNKPTANPPKGMCGFNCRN